MLFSFFIHVVICITLATQGIAVAQVTSFFAYFFISPESLVPRFHYPYHLIPSLGPIIVNRLALVLDNIETLIETILQVHLLSWRKESPLLVCEVVM